MKRIITLLCAAMMACSLIVTASAATGVSASISRSKSSINAGDKVTITLSGKATGCSSGGVEVSFNSSVFELVSGSCVVSGAFMKDFDTKTKDGVFAFDSASKISGKVLTFTLKAKSNAATGKYNVTVKFKADSTTVSKTTTITIACEHTYSDNCDASCNKCGATRNPTHKWGSPTVVTEATCKSKGTAKYKCSGCGETKTEAIAKSEHTYDHNCDVDCNVCGATRTVTHTYAWACDETQHWQECTACKAPLEKADHTLATEMTGDETGHGYACTVCMLIPKAEGHAFDSVCDDSCDSCGYVRKVYHSYSGRYTTDKDAHWNICVLCDKVINKGNHTPGPAATETTDQSCTKCGYVIAKAENHTHSKFDDYLSNEKGHWYTCHCGEDSEVVAHNWDKGTIDEEKEIVTYVCADCGYRTAEVYDPEFVFTFENLVTLITESPVMMIITLSLCGSVAINLVLLIVVIVQGSKNRKLKKNLQL